VAVASAAPSKVLERVDETLAAIAVARQRLEEERASVLGPQDRLFQEIAHCDDVLATIGQARTEWMGPLLSRDSLSIWRPEARTLTSINLGSRLGESVGDTIELTRQFSCRSGRTRTVAGRVVRDRVRVDAPGARPSAAAGREDTE
jgi:hypothetical protein